MEEKTWLSAMADAEPWRTRLNWKGHTFFADEPENLGGKNTAPSPGVLLMASLASCTLITIQMYAQRKNIDVTGLEVQVRYDSVQENGKRATAFEKRLKLPDHLEEAVKERLRQVSEACPVSKILNGAITTATVPG